MNETDKALTPDLAWTMIQEMGWGTETTDYDALSEKFFEKWGKLKMQQLESFVSDRVYDLAKAVTQYEEKNNCPLQVGSDDGFSDLRYHVVGLGKKEFEKNLKNPKLLQKRESKGEYKESFHYAFQEPRPRMTEQQKTDTFADLANSLNELYKQIEDIQSRLTTVSHKIYSIDVLLGNLKKNKKTIDI